MSDIIYSPASTTGYGACISDDCWLKDPVDSSLNISVSVDGADSFKINFEYGMGSFDVIGRRNKVPVVDLRKGDEFEFTLQVLRDDEPAIDTMIDNARTLLLQLTDGRQWYFVIDKGQKNLFAGVGDYLTIDIKAIEVDQPLA